MSKKFLLIFLLALFLNSCHQRGDMPISAVSTKAEELITDEGDTILTGVRLPHKGVPISADSMTKARTVPLKGTPKVVPAHTNLHPAGRPTVVRIPRDLKVFTPGKDSLSLPETKPVEGAIIPAGHQKPVAVLPPSKRDNARYNIRYWNEEHGFNANVTSAVLEDSRGQLWFGTRGNGVFRFDGKQATHFTKEEGLITNVVLFILEDSKGNIWLGGNGGVCYYDGQKFTQYSVEAGFPRIVFAAIEDGHSNLWFGTIAGAVRFDGENITRFTAKEGLSDEVISSVLKDSHGNLWFGTWGDGAICYDGKSFIHYTVEEGLCFDFVNAIAEDRNGQLWFGTGASGIMGRGVSKFDGQHFTSYSIDEGMSGNRIQAIVKDGQGDLWFGTYDGGVSRFDGQVFTHYTVEEGLSFNSILSMALDRQGNLWLGTNGGGINRLNFRSFSLFSTNEGLNQHYVESMAEDGRGNLWFGTTTNGAFCYDGQNFTHYTEKEGLSSNRVASIFADNSGGIWMGSRFNGALYLDPYEKGGVITYYTTAEGLWTDYVSSIHKDRQNNVWFETRFGLDRLEKQKIEGVENNSFVHFQLDAIPRRNWTQFLFEDSRGNLWIGRAGTVIGSSRFEPPVEDTIGFLTHFGPQEGLDLGNVFAVLEGHNGHIWFGGSGGVRLFDGEQFYPVEIESGFSNFEVRSLTEDMEGNIWVAAVDRISLIYGEKTPDVISQPGDFKIITFRKPDGLPMSEFRTSLLDSKNRLWFGGTNGLVMMDLNHFELPKQAPGDVTLTHIDIEQQFMNFRGLANADYTESFPIGQSVSQSFDSVAEFYNYPLNLNLSHDLNHLTFHFSAIDWASPNQIKYSYRMEGVDEEWSPPQEESRADYRNINPGTYTFKVKAIGIAGKWSEPFSYTFTIRPPWWQTIWAYIIYAFFIFLLGYLLYQSLLNRRLEKEEARRLRELDEVKTKLYTNITHEFRTPLTIILGMADKVKNNPKKWLGEGVNMIKRNGHQLLHLVNQILDLRKLESGKLSLNPVQADILSFLKYHLEAFHTYAEDRDIRLHFLTNEEEIRMDFAPREIQYIVNNLVSNAIKYNKEGGDVYLKVDRQGDQLQVQVEDNGIGIPEDQLPYIFDRFYQAESLEHQKLAKAGGGTGIGLALTKELIKLMEGSISVKSKEGESTIFELLLPIRQTHDFVPSSELGMKEYYSKLSAVSSAKVETITNLVSRPQILIVEDNKDVVFYLQSCLQAEYQLEVAYDGAEGIEKALEQIPDLILSDVMMPRKDGFELCTALKQDMKTSHIPIILLTARGDQDSRLEGLKHGADAYLAKPFEEQELLVRIDQMIQLRKHLQEKYSDPLLQGDLVRNDMETEFIQSLRELVKDHLEDETFGIAQLCRDLFMSRTQLHRKLKSLTGKSTSIVVREIRLERARELLSTTDLSISEVSYQTGFSSTSYFTQVFVETYGQTPSDFKLTNEK